MTYVKLALLELEEGRAARCARILSEAFAKFPAHFKYPACSVREEEEKGEEGRGREGRKGREEERKRKGGERREGKEEKEGREEEGKRKGR